MAIKLQSDLVVGTRTVPQAFTAGAVVAYLVDITIPTGVTLGTSDIVELGVLPAFHRVVDAMVVAASGFTDEKADIGIMTGAVGDDGDATRTSGNELFDDVGLTALARMTKSAAIVLASTDKDRSIGMKFTASLTGAGQTVTLQFLLAQ